LVPSEELRDEILEELSESTALLDTLPSGVTVFGSARTTLEPRFYDSAYRLGQWLARAELPVLTGGGPGVMEAVSRGARSEGGFSVGLNIQLPYEETPNAFLTHRLYFRHFATRKLMLTRYARGFVVYPGGFGTVDELLELLVAFHTNQASRKPMVLIDQPFWSGLLDWFDSELAARKLIDLDKTDFIQVVDDELAALGVLLGADVAAELTHRFAG
jgi:uncharacterized protein (TIGR00730 family)